MGKRVGALALLVTLLAAGALLGSSLSQWWVETEAPPPPPVSTPQIQGRVKVEVLNRGGRSGVAREATGALRDLGFDVVYYGNAGTFTEDSSVVLDRVGRLEAARWAADALGVLHVRSEPDSSRYVDITVVLGPEWTLRSEGIEGETEPAAPWWDLRRYFRRDDSMEVEDKGNR